MTVCADSKFLHCTETVHLRALVNIPPQISSSIPARLPDIDVWLARKNGEIAQIISGIPLSNLATLLSPGTPKDLVSGNGASRAQYIGQRGQLA